jgi:Rrf2 family protein
MSGRRWNMQMSTRGRYALRAMFELAMHEGCGPVSLGHISSAQGIPGKYLEQLFGMLRKAGLIKAMRGPAGGYLLSRDAKSISIGDVIRVAEGVIAPVYCVDGDAEERCEREEKCICHLYWERLERHIGGFLDSSTLFDLCEESRGRELA